MTRRRWIADEVSGDRAALVGPHAEHLAVVLRARVGQRFDISIGQTLRSGRILSVTPQRVEFELGAELPSPTPAKLTLLLAIFKFDRMEWAIEKCTELGCSRIVPLIASRSDAHLIRAAGVRRERWQRIARQASEQSRGTATPQIDPPCKLKDVLKMPAPMRVVLAESERQLSLRDALAEHPSNEELLLAIGPEGGWTDAELELFSTAEWISASLGATILRAETAAIAATAVAMAELS